MAKRLLAFGLFTFLAVGPVFGQAHSLKADVPYSFNVGSKVLPAGTYTFSMPTDNPAWIEVQPATGSALRARIVTRLGGPTQFQDGSLVFDKTDSTRVLSEVWIPGADGILVHAMPKGHTHDILMSSGSAPGANLNGKQAFDRTCAKCHGLDGGGAPGADKFFDTAIPRLNSAAVQSKSDAELKEIITTGRRGMPPVETDEGGYRHRIPADLVDSVIAYVRTLKK
jgi:cytochrome c5